MADTVVINNRSIKLSAIIALRPYNEASFDPRLIDRNVNYAASVLVYNRRPMQARRELSTLANELGFPLFQSRMPVALNPAFRHFRIDAYHEDIATGLRMPDAQSVISWRSEYGRFFIPLREPIDEVVSHLPLLAQRVHVMAERPEIAQRPARTRRLTV